MKPSRRRLRKRPMRDRGRCRCGAFLIHRECPRCETRTRPITHKRRPRIVDESLEDYAAPPAADELPERSPYRDE